MKNKFCFFSLTCSWILLIELTFFTYETAIGFHRLFPVQGTSVTLSSCWTLQSSPLLSVVWMETKQTSCHHATPAQEQPDQQGDSVMTKHLSSFFLTSAFTQTFRTMSTLWGKHSWVPGGINIVDKPTMKSHH